MSYPKKYFINTLQDYEVGSSPFAQQNWKSKIHETVNVITHKQKPSVKAADGGLYVGIAGIGYMFYHMSRLPTFAGDKPNLLEKGLGYIQPALEYAERHKNDKSQKSAFLLGNAGVYAVAAALYHALGVYELPEVYNKQHETCLELKPLRTLQNFVRFSRITTDILIEGEVDATRIILTLLNHKPFHRILTVIVCTMTKHERSDQS
jgi:hypothetical protein